MPHAHFLSSRLRTFKSVLLLSDQIYCSVVKLTVRMKKFDATFTDMLYASIYLPTLISRNPNSRGWQFRPQKKFTHVHAAAQVHEPISPKSGVGLVKVRA